MICLVNGICVGLAGKLSVLGRATSLADYVLVGQEEVGTMCAPPPFFCLKSEYKGINYAKYFIPGGGGGRII